MLRLTEQTAWGLVVGVVLVIIGAAELWVCWLGSQRRLSPNKFVGIRLPVTRASDEAWYVAHEAAAGPLGIGGAIAAACGAAVLVAGLDLVGVAVAALGAVALLTATSVATVAAVRAARELPDEQTA